MQRVCFLFICITLLITGLAKVLERSKHLEITAPYDSNHKLRFYCGVIAVLLLGILGWIKLETPIRDGVQSCIILPHISSTECVFSADSPWNMSTTFSRSPRDLTFGGIRGWAIGAFNTDHFFNTRKSFRASDSRSRSPFKDRLGLGNNIVHMLKRSNESSKQATYLLQYAGGVWIDSTQGTVAPEIVFPFSKGISTALVRLPEDNLNEIVFTYVNYMCKHKDVDYVVGEIRKDKVTGNHTYHENCSKTWNIDSLHDSHAFFRIMFLYPGSNSKFIDHFY